MTAGLLRALCHWNSEATQDLTVEEHRLRLVADHRDIDDKWQFSEPHTQELFRQYYYANKLLINCLNSASKAKSITPKVRSHIEDTLLLPIDEIEKWKVRD